MQPRTLRLGHSKCGPQTSAIRITWELTGNAGSSVLAQKYCLRTESQWRRGVLYTPSFKTCGVKAPQVWVLRGIQGRSAFTSLIHGGLFSYKLGGGIYTPWGFLCNHLFIEHLVCAGHYSRQRDTAVSTADIVPGVKGLTARAEMGDDQTNDQDMSDSGQGEQRPEPRGRASRGRHGMGHPGYTKRQLVPVPLTPGLRALTYETTQWVLRKAKVGSRIWAQTEAVKWVLNFHEP